MWWGGDPWDPPMGLRGSVGSAIPATPAACVLRWPWGLARQPTPRPPSGDTKPTSHHLAAGPCGSMGVPPPPRAFLCPAGSNTVETGTIAGIASALAMALVGAVSSYISYQQKKFCFSIQQGLNAEYVKGENMEAVVSEEPQVKYSVLETQSAEPPKQDSAKI
uniref:CD99 antigen-like protein 2 n=1 Tax=Anser cygnoides TaxID=8845 RepID=A0A8B9IEF8_ANSCY